MLRVSICRSRTCCSSATSRRPATRRRRSACVTGRASSASASCRCAECDQRRTAAADAGGGESARRTLDGDRRRQRRRSTSSTAGCHRCSRRWRRGSTSSAACTRGSTTRRRSSRRPSVISRRLIDVRTPPRDIPIASGRKRSGKRLLTVGTDCALGKKYTALAIARAFEQRGVDADFRATGQTGIMIAGGGMPMDAVVADFEAGAAEMLSPDCRAGSLGCDRRAGLAVSSGVRRRVARTAARQPARRDRRLS